MATRNVLIMAGGTGGHVFPALAAADCFRQQGLHVEWLGTAKGIESSLVPVADIKLHCLNVAGLRGKGIKALLKAPFQLFCALKQAIHLIRQVKPVCVLGMGGFASGPGGLAAWLLRKPLVIHEQNAVAGTTNRLLAPLSKQVLCGYPIALGGRKNQFIGNPVRPEITQLPSPDERGVGASKRLRILVLGGSLGAKAINDVLPVAISNIAKEQRPEIWHQTGKAHDENVEAVYTQLGVEAKVEAFIDDMAKAYGWADLVICRAGALTVAELTAAGLASVLVPLPHAIDDHQTENARWLSENKAGILLKQSELTPTGLAEMLNNYENDRDVLMTMAKAARALAKIEVAQQIVTTCLEVACE